jgi:hypothetical protein
MTMPLPEPGLDAAAPGETRPAAATPHFSLLRLSAAERLMGVVGVLAMLWSAVWWAL